MVRELIDNNPSISIRNLLVLLDMSILTVWRILRKELKMFPYKPKNIQHLTQVHKDGRIAFCRWISAQSQEFAAPVLWSDEKLWEERVRSNKQNKRCWS